MENFTFFNSAKVQQCDLPFRSFLARNSTSAGTEEGSRAALDIIYGPVLPGVCGGVVALMTIVGFGEFLRRRRIFQKLRRRYKKTFKKYFRLSLLEYFRIF